MGDYLSLDKHQSEKSMVLGRLVEPRHTEVTFRHCQCLTRGTQLAGSIKKLIKIHVVGVHHSFSHSSIHSFSHSLIHSFSIFFCVIFHSLFLIGSLDLFLITRTNLRL